MSDAKSQARYRDKKRRTERGEMEVADWFTRNQRRTLVTMGLLDKNDIDDPEAVRLALAGLMARLEKTFPPCR
jgi:hypothetical protein